MEESMPQVPPLTDLVKALEQATLTAKQLPATTDQTQFHQLHSSLQTITNQLTSFLSLIPSSSSQPPRPIQAYSNSFSSAVGGDDNDNNEAEQLQPMQIGEEEEEEDNSSQIVIDKVEERFRHCNIHYQNKRRKRRLSPTSAAVADQRGFDHGVFHNEFDPHGTRLRSFDLVFQFHG